MSDTMLVSAIGSMPGTEMAETIRQVADAIPDLLALPELPARGPGGEMIGRTFGLLNQLDSQFSIETTVTGWRTSRGENRAMRRAKSWYQEDMDWLEKLVSANSAQVKLQFAGPLTLAAFVEPQTGESLIQDAGAVREISTGLSEVIRNQLKELRRRMPNTDFIIQIDEPALELVLHGGIKRRSGRGNLEPFSIDAAAGLMNGLTTEISAEAAKVWLHSCATNFQNEFFTKTKFDALAVPFSAVSNPANFETVSALWDRDGFLLLGIAPQLLANEVKFQSIITAVNRFSNQIGLSMDSMSALLGLSPECGLAYVNEPIQILSNLQRVAIEIQNEAS